jgi:hypothetical protein
MTASLRAVVSPADVSCAQAALDALVDVLEGREDGSWLSRAAQLELRGLLTAQMAQVRLAGYLDGQTCPP